MKHHLTLDVPDEQDNGDLWGLLSYLTDAYGLPESVADNEGGITATIETTDWRAMADDLADVLSRRNTDPHSDWWDEALMAMARYQEARPQ